MALDECSFYPNLDPRFGYSLKGSREVSKRRPDHKGKYYTLLFAISSLKENGVIYWDLVEGSVNREVFYNLLEKINPIGNRKNILLMDSSQMHAAPNLPTTEEQMAKKNIKVSFITTYAPMLNLEELVFCLLRQQTEKQWPRNYEELKLLIYKLPLSFLIFRIIISPWFRK